MLLRGMLPKPSVLVKFLDEKAALEKTPRFAILISGSRFWSDEELIYKTLSTQSRRYQNVTLIHGDCVGADKLAAKCGLKLGFSVKSFPAQWSKFGKAAGPMRNKVMVDELLKYDINEREMIVFHDNLKQSKGTVGCIEIAMSNGITPTIISHNPQI